MNPGDLIKSIIEKIKLWYKNWFYKKKKKKKEESKKQMQEIIDKKKKIYNNTKMIIDDKKNSSIGTMYPNISIEKLNYLKRKKTFLKKKFAIEDEETLKNLNDILESINQDLYINQFVEIDDLLENFNLSETSTKTLSVLTEEISTIIDKKLDDYELSIINKANKEYNKVNYIIVTTLIIDDIIKEITKLEEDFKKNKYTKIQYEQKVRSLKERIEKLEKINNQKEVQEEIKRLKKDFYTKKKDKYDLLYNDEIFINITAKCDEILEKVRNKEKAEQIIVKNKEAQKQQKLEEQKKAKEKVQKKIEEQKKELEIEKENIVKRFIDTQIAHKIILLREKFRKKITDNNELIIQTLHYYDDFITGEKSVFNFERNKTKTEIVKLYNDITSTLCTIQKKEFVPLEHINIKLSTLTEQTLQNQGVLNYLVEKTTNYKISETDYSKATTTKLTTILGKEKNKGSENTKTKDKPKVLKKEFKPDEKNN